MASGYHLTCAIVLFVAGLYTWESEYTIAFFLFVCFFACETTAIFPSQYYRHSNYKNQKSCVLWEIMYKISLYALHLFFFY